MNVNAEDVNENVNEPAVEQPEEDLTKGAAKSSKKGRKPAGVKAAKGKKAAKAPAKKAAKAAKAPKAAKEKKAAKPRTGGVIGVIAEMISRDEGASKGEILAALAKKFPDRQVDSMKTTVALQVGRLPKRFEFSVKKTQDEKRGLVYKTPKSLYQAYLKSGASQSE